MTNLSHEELYGQYKAVMSRIADLRFSSALLQWDQETYMPPRGAPLRGQQIASLTEMAHELFTRKPPEICSLISGRLKVLLISTSEMPNLVLKTIPGNRKYLLSLYVSCRKLLTRVFTAGWQQERQMILACFPEILPNS